MIFGVCTDRYPRCPSPDGHLLAIPKDFINETLGQCTYRPAKGHGPCGKYVYAVRVVRQGEPKALARDDVLWFIAEIDRSVYYALKQFNGTWAERMTLIGATLPNVDIDLQEAG